MISLRAHRRSLLGFVVQKSLPAFSCGCEGRFFWSTAITPGCSRPAELGRTLFIEPSGRWVWLIINHFSGLLYNQIAIEWRIEGNLCVLPARAGSAQQMWWWPGGVWGGGGSAVGTTPDFCQTVRGDSREQNMLAFLVAKLFSSGTE